MKGVLLIVKFYSILELAEGSEDNRMLNTWVQYY